MRIDWDALLPPKQTAAANTKATMEAADEQHEQPAPDAGIVAREQQGDDRRRCTECRNLGERGVCVAATHGLIAASRSYVPIRDILRRCEGFTPLPSDPDQTPGHIKWAWLLKAQQ